MTTKKTPNRGKPFNCWMRDEDMGRIRKLAAFISTRGHRVSDSQVIKAALHISKPDSRFLKAFEEVLAQDGRFRQD